MIYKKEIFTDPLNENEIEAYANDKGLLCIQVSEVGRSYDYVQFVALNKDTAEAFVKAIQEQIKLLDNE